MIPALLALWVVQFVVGVKVLAFVTGPVNDSDKTDITVFAALGLWFVLVVFLALFAVTCWLTRKRP